MARTRQPQGAVRVNTSSPLARGLSFLFDGSLRRNAVDGTLLTPVNAPTTVAKSDGLRNNFVAASSQYIGGGESANVTFANGPITVAIRYSLTTIPASGSAFSLFTRDSNTGRSFTVDVQNTTGADKGLRLYVQGGGGSLGTNILYEGRQPVAGDDRFCVMVWDNSKNRSELWVNGVLVVATTATFAVGSASTPLAIGRRAYPSFEDYLNGTIGLAAAWKRALSASEIAEVSRNPWQLFAPTRRVWVQLGATGGTGATGTSAATLEGVTGTAVGTLAIAAASAATLGAVTGTAAGAAAIAGVSAQTLEETTGTAAATLAIAATSAATLAATTGTAVGTLAIAATSAQTVSVVTGTANGTTLGAASGTSAATLAATTGTAAGTLALAATSSATVGIVTGTSAGTISVGGASAQALSDVTGVAVGNTTGATNGVSIVTLDSVSGSAAGYADILATSAGALEAISGTAAGAISIIGVSADILADVTCGVPPPTLPLEVPTSSRTLAAAVIRLGASPLAAESPRLGTTPVRKAPPRLG